MSLKEKVNNLPLEPGVYIMKGQKGEVLYIGKAKELRKRVRSYFREQVLPKTKQMVSRIADIEVMITPTELDALVLESNLIKKYRPFYNLDLKDDKRYPYLKLTVNEKYPRLLIVRKYKEDGARYFGPFAGKGTILKALKILRTTFPLRQCSEKLPKKPCLELQIKRCLGPCVSPEVGEEYMQAVEELILFLEGKYEDALQELQSRMKRAAKSKQYEMAAVYRDRIRKLEKIGQHQEMVLTEKVDQDVLVFFSTEKEEALNILKVRGGKVIGNEVVFYEKKQEEENIHEKVLIKYYERKDHLPTEIVIEEALNTFPMLRYWLSTAKNIAINLISDPDNELIRMAKRNIEYIKIQKIEKEEVLDETLEEIQATLSIDYLPARIEGYDISNIGGSNIIGSQVVFVDGNPAKKEYRHYKIRTVKGRPDDLASMQEILTRRCAKLKQGGVQPELILVDGGKGQLAVAEKAVRNAGLSIPTISLAKEHEDVFYKGKKVNIPKDSKAQKLLQKIRDEAHRFGINFHRKQRASASLSSPILEIPGVGAQTRKKLLQKFRDVKEIRNASLDRIRQVASAKLAQKIYNYFHGGK